jgi:hypothetical protein
MNDYRKPERSEVGSLCCLLETQLIFPMINYEFLAHRIADRIVGKKQFPKPSEQSIHRHKRFARLRLASKCRRIESLDDDNRRFFLDN